MARPKTFSRNPFPTPDCLSDWEPVLYEPDTFTLHDGGLSFSEYIACRDALTDGREWRGHSIYEISGAHFREDDCVNVTITAYAK